MRILLVTGRLAEKIVREKIRESKTHHKVDVIVLPVQVIALLSTRDIAKILTKKGINKRKYDLIIIPGQCRGSAEEIHRETGVPAVKGTIHAHDIPLLLQLEDPLHQLSPDKPADEVIRDMILESNKKLLKKLELSIGDKALKIGDLLIPYRPPPFRIISEISNAHLLGKDELLYKVNYYVEEGADIVSLGFDPFNPHPDKVFEIVSFLKKELDIPLAIDTSNPSEIIAGVKAGADLILSIDECNLEKVLGILKTSKTPFVLIPFNSCKNYLPPHRERIILIDKLYDKLTANGVENFIIDPILDPPITGNVLKSLHLYMEVSRKYMDKPLLMGIGNITELIDADSIGLNTLLTLLALDAGVSVLLTVEYSDKTQGSTRELKIATQMISLAHIRKTPPKDLGIDLLVVKDKRKILSPFEVENAEVIEVVEEKSVETKIDPMGIFKIRVNYRDKVLEALYIGKKGKKLIRARKPQAIASYILREKLVSTLSHALYLGQELAKAGEALILNKNYVQEKPLFEEKKFIKFNEETR